MKLTITIDTEKNIDKRKLNNILAASANIIHTFILAAAEPLETNTNHFWGGGIKEQGVEYNLEVKIEK